MPNEELRTLELWNAPRLTRLVTLKISHRAWMREPLVNLNARVPKHLWRRVRLQCLREGRLLRAFVTEALQEHLSAQKRRPRRQGVDG